MEKFVRSCDICGYVKEFKSRGALNVSIARSPSCVNCTPRASWTDDYEIPTFKNGVWIRHCPQCNREVTHTNKDNCRGTIVDGRLCTDCGAKKAGRPGETNPFYGRKHTDETKRNIGEKAKARWNNMTDEEKEAYVEKWIVAGQRASQATLKEKSLLEIWIDRYGEDEANVKMNKLRETKSKNSSGSNNPMYGRSPSKHTGIGYKGWYKGSFFRSLLELSFMTTYTGWSTGETGKWRAKYQTDEGTDKTTVPDFVVNAEKIVYECKPLSLHRTSSVRAKATAMTQLAESRGYTYVLLDPGVISCNQLLNLIDDGDVVLTDATKEKFTEWQTRRH